MQILADRFLVDDDGVAIDLATGGRVILRVEAGGGAGEQTRWATQRQLLHRLHHPAGALLIDYGALGTSRRFEAWSCGPKGHAGIDATLQAVEASPPPTLLEDHGILRIERPAIAAVACVFQLAAGCRPRVVTLWGAPGSGKTTAILDIARAARLSGFTPIGVDVAGRIKGSLLIGRYLCLIDDGANDSPWSVLVKASCRTPRPHVVVLATEEERQSIDSVALEPVSAARLTAAVWPAPSSGLLVRRAERAATAARGLPGRFARLIWKGSSMSFSASRGTKIRASRVAEQRLTYGSSESVASPWPAPGELLELRRRAEGAILLIARGRHAPGVRQLRQAVGGLARRGDWRHAAAGAHSLATAFIARGNLTQAAHALEHALRYADRASDEGAAIDVAILRGHLAIDRAQLDEAETILGAALTAARGREYSSRVAPASLALARCLFWKGRYDDAEAALVPAVSPLRGGAIKLRATALLARTAIGANDIVRAMARLSEVREQADRVGTAKAAALASYTAGFVHLAANDLLAAGQHLVACLAAARADHDPLRAVRARLMLAECARRRGQGRLTSTATHYIQRVAACLPPLVRARAELIAAVSAAPKSVAAAGRAHAARSGLRALTLYTPGLEERVQAGGLTPAVMEEFVAIIQTCQAAEEDAALLSQLCAKVQGQVHAGAVAFCVPEHGAIHVVASSGGRVEVATAERAMDAGQSIAPHRQTDRLEAAAPVCYGGQTAGAIVARWPLGTSDDLSRAANILTMAATAAAPVLSALVARRSRPAVTATSEILGLSGPIVELRRGIERAASAPFAVLIEGESGSGKELVARALHRSGSRRDRPFCTLNCAAIPDDLVEAELFGHARGAFTGAMSERPGVFEEAHGGVLFLDEVGELSARAQAKLLRVIQEGELRRIGENLSRHVDVRIVSATNRDLRQEVAAGRFRQDLLYRLDVIRISVPPLRERLEDIVLLVDHVWRQATLRIDSRATLAVATAATLARYDWPGNVRELQNVLAALAVRSPRRGVVPPAALPPHLNAPRSAEGCRLHEARRTFEARFVRAALVRTGGHRSRAAEELGVTRQGLAKLMTRLGIND